MAMVRNRTGQFSKSPVDSRKQRARERASKLNQKPVVACDRAKVENKVDKFQGCIVIDRYLLDFEPFRSDLLLLFLQECISFMYIP